MKKNFFNYIVILLLFLVTMFMFTSASAYNFLDKYMVYVFLVLDLIMLLLNSKVKIKKNYMLLLLILNGSLMLLSLFLSYGGIGSLLCTINFMVLLCLSDKGIIDDINPRLLYTLILIFYLLAAYISFSIWNRYLYSSNVINPNTVAVVLLYMTIMISVLIEKSNQKHKNITTIVLCICSIFFIINCHCRNAMIALLAFLTIILFPKIRIFIAKHISIVLFLIIITGLIIPFVYSQQLFREINFLSFVSGKSIYSGRETIWRYMIMELSSKKYGYLIGLGSHNVTDLGIIVNYHTWFLGIIYMYGIPFFCFYFYYLINSIKKVKSDIIKVGFIAIFITGIFETSAIWINLQYLIFILLLLDQNNKERYHEKIDSIHSNV